MFGGVSQENIKCNNKKCGRITQYPMENLPQVLPVSLEGTSLQSCLDKFWLDEEIEISCESCSSGRMTKSISIIVEPISLILQLKRYEFDTEKNRTEKKLDPIICPKTLVFPSKTRYTLN